MTEQLSSYIKANLAKGISKEAIESSLLQSGWTKDQIEQAFLSPDSQPESQLGQTQTTVSGSIVNEKTGFSKKLLWVVILLLFTLPLTGVAVFAFIQFKKLESNQPVSSNNSGATNRTLTLAMTSIPTPSPTPKKSTEEELQLLTKDWKIYRNEQYQFEVKYPPDWIAEGKPDNIGRFGLKISPDSNKDLTQNFYVWPEERFSETVFEDSRFSSLIQNTAIDGRKARELPVGLYTVVVPDPTTYTRTIRIDDVSGLKNWKEKNSINYDVDKKYSRLQSDPQLLNTFGTIVSTFKFLD